MIATDAVKEFVGSSFADEINALHAEISTLGKTALEKAIRIGELLVAQKATSLAAYEDTWAKFTFDDAELIDAAAQAADAWNELATYLRRLPLPPDEDLPF